jgi:hypothetical protein
VFNSPNGRSLACRWAGEGWAMLALLEHGQFFTPRAVEWLAGMLRLRVRRLRVSGSPFPMGAARGGPVQQGIVDLPVRTLTLPRAPEATHTAARVRRVVSVLRSLRREILARGATGPVASALRAMTHLCRLGDHLEVILTRDRD